MKLSNPLSWGYGLRDEDDTEGRDDPGGYKAPNLELPEGKDPLLSEDHLKIC